MRETSAESGAEAEGVRGKGGPRGMQREQGRILKDLQAMERHSHGEVQ